jgi:hypothetical protein
MLWFRSYMRLIGNTYQRAFTAGSAVIWSLALPSDQLRIEGCLLKKGKDIDGSLASCVVASGLEMLIYRRVNSVFSPACAQHDIP